MQQITNVVSGSPISAWHMNNIVDNVNQLTRPTSSINVISQPLIYHIDVYSNDPDLELSGGCDDKTYIDGVTIKNGWLLYHDLLAETEPTQKIYQISPDDWKVVAVMNCTDPYDPNATPDETKMDDLPIGSQLLITRGYSRGTICVVVYNKELTNWQ